MSLVAAAICPHPLLLVPRFAGAAAPELDELRAACRQAIALVLGTLPELIVVVGSGPRTETYASGARGTLGPWGVPLTISLGPPDPDGGVVLPLSLTLGAWLLGAPPRPVRGQAVAADAAPAECAALGATLVADRRTALLVMGDASACRTEKAPGYLDPRAEPFDAAAARAFVDGDLAALRGIDVTEAADLLCGGRAPWQVLAGAAGERPPPHRRLHYDAAPYGVGYLVASWS